MATENQMELLAERKEFRKAAKQAMKDAQKKRQEENRMITVKEAREMVAKAKKEAKAEAEKVAKEQILTFLETFSNVINGLAVHSASILDVLKQEGYIHEGEFEYAFSERLKNREKSMQELEEQMKSVK